MKTFGIVGWSGSGKTTLLDHLIPVLVARGIRVSTVKHTHHDIDLDKPGKDSHRHREAGATEVAVTGPTRWAIIHELRDGAPEPSLEDLLARLDPVDLVLVEGYKSHRFPKLEVHRPSVGKPLLAAGDATVVAVATDTPGLDAPVPVLSLDDAAAIADFILSAIGVRT